MIKVVIKIGDNEKEIIERVDKVKGEKGKERLGKQKENWK